MSQRLGLGQRGAGAFAHAKSAKDGWWWSAYESGTGHRPGRPAAARISNRSGRGCESFELRPYVSGQREVPVPELASPAPVER